MKIQSFTKIFWSHLKDPSIKQIIFILSAIFIKCRYLKHYLSNMLSIANCSSLMSNSSLFLASFLIFTIACGIGPLFRDSYLIVTSLLGYLRKFWMMHDLFLIKKFLKL